MYRHYNFTILQLNLGSGCFKASIQIKSIPATAIKLATWILQRVQTHTL